MWRTKSARNIRRLRTVAARNPIPRRRLILALGGAALSFAAQQQAASTRLSLQIELQQRVRNQHAAACEDGQESQRHAGDRDRRVLRSVQTNRLNHPAGQQRRPQSMKR